MSRAFSFRRVGAVLQKEFIQIWRDHVTIAIIMVMPIMQLLLFGYAINMDPKHLPTALAIEDRSMFSDAIVAGLMNSDYFKITHVVESVGEGERLLDRGDVTFVITIPADFSRALVRGERPQVLLQVDASDPSSGARAVATFPQLVQEALRDDLNGPLARPAAASPVDVVVQPRYNPENNTQFNIIPGLLGVILTMSLALISSFSVTRERERGTLENLIAMPASSLELMLGKIGPYVGVGFLQAVMILLSADFLFDVPMNGSYFLLGLVLFLFVLTNLAIGYTFSTFAQSQLQAMQMVVFFVLPSILLSGFAFPFRGMPLWAQAIGEALPITHFLRIVRGLLLKDNGLPEIWPDLWPLALIVLVASLLAMARFRRTLD